jgi:dTMP kinase
MTYYCIIGIDGCGKSTICQMIQDSGYDAVFTREPYYPDVKEAVGRVDCVELSYLFSLDRYQHMRDVIIPTLSLGQYIISDRCYICNLAYQSYDGLLDVQWLMGLQPPNLVFPDYVIWLQSDPETAARRSGECAERLKGIQRSYHEVLNSYELPLMAWFPVNVDGKTKQDVFEEVMAIIKENKK